MIKTLGLKKLYECTATHIEYMKLLQDSEAYT